MRKNAREIVKLLDSTLFSICSEKINMVLQNDESRIKLLPLPCNIKANMLMYEDPQRSMDSGIWNFWM